MTFEEALKALRQGKKVKRACWEWSYLFMKDGKIFNHKSGNKQTDMYMGNFAQMLIMADDWLVIE